MPNLQVVACWVQQRTKGSNVKGKKAGVQKEKKGVKERNMTNIWIPEKELIKGE